MIENDITIGFLLVSNEGESFSLRESTTTVPKAHALFCHSGPATEAHDFLFSEQLSIFSRFSLSFSAVFAQNNTNKSIVFQGEIVGMC